MQPKIRPTILATASFMSALLIGTQLLAIPTYALGICNPETGENCIFEGRMTGGGKMVTEDHVVTHGFTLHCSAEDKPNNLQVNWDSGNHFHLQAIGLAFCEDDPNAEPNPPNAPFDTITINGFGRYNGVSGAFIFAVFQDAGEPGNEDTTPDYSTIVIFDKDGNLVLLLDSTPLFGGNHQAHKSNK